MSDIYTVEIDGVEYDIEGDRPPTEAEARAAVGAFQTPKQATAPPAAATAGMLPPSTVAGDPDPRELAISKAQRFAQGAPGSIPLVGGGGMAPGVIAKAKPLAGRALEAAGNFFGHPAVGGAVGAIQGYESGGAGGAIQQGATYAAGGYGLGKTLGVLGRRLNPPANPNAGGRLVPRQTPTVNESIDEALEAVRGPQAPTARTPGIIARPQSVSLPDQGPGPSVTMSPKAQQVAAVGRAPSRSPSKSSGSLDAGMERMYQELARKPILSPEEQQTFDRLHAIVSARASHMGRSYAARGSVR